MIIKVKAKPNSKENKIILEDNIYKVYIKEQPEKNKANIAILKLLKKKFNKEIKLIKGVNAKEKLFEVK